MKKIICLIVTLAVFMGFCACKSKNEVCDDGNQDNTFVVDGKVVVDYCDIERGFISELRNNGYKFSIYNIDDLTAQGILENRTELDSIIVERVIGVVKDQNGDGTVLNTKNPEAYYINYDDAGFETHEGMIILTYFIYNPDTNYIADTIARYDFVLDDKR